MLMDYRKDEKKNKQLQMMMSDSRSACDSPLAMTSFLFWWLIRCCLEVYLAENRLLWLLSGVGTFLRESLHAP